MSRCLHVHLERQVDTPVRLSVNGAHRYLCLDCNEIVAILILERPHFRETINVETTNDI